MTGDSNLSDEQELIIKAKAGDANAFGRLIMSHRKRVYAICYDLSGSNDEAQDVAQETYIKAYKGLEYFKGESSFSTWIYRIAVHTWIDYCRSRSRRESMLGVIDDADTLQDTNIPQPDALADAAILSKIIEKALYQLSPQQRAVFVLRHYHEFALAEIAISLGISEGSVKTLLFRAMKKMREMLRRHRS